MISYKPFWETLKYKNVSTYALREKYGISPNTLTRMKSNKYLSMRTIEDFCKILDCEIEDIVKYNKDKFLLVSAFIIGALSNGVCRQCSS